MLRLKIIKGPGLGQTIQLKPGENIVGRVAPSEVILGSSGVSKKHAKLTVSGDTCVVSDLGSSNGTYVNGVKIKDRIVKPGDRIGFHDVIVELISDTQSARLPMPTQPPSQWNQPLPFQNQGPFSAPTGASPQQPTPAQNKSFMDYLKAYVDKVVLPGVYRLNEMYSMNLLIGVFLALFVLIVTVLSTIPMAELTRDGVQKEAQRRALTVARQMAFFAEKSLIAGQESTIRTDFAESEEGVKAALVISREDGRIIAPLTKAQSYSNETFVAKARTHDETYVEQISDTLVGASVPIRSFSPEIGAQTIAYYSVVIYKMDSLNYSATVALFARILIIAAVIGGILYFLLYKLVSHPIQAAVMQMDEALRGDRDTLESKYDYEPFSKLIDSINSALSRMGSPSQQASQNIDRTSEVSNLVRIIANPAFALDENGKFIQVNAAFEELTGMRLLTLQGQGLETLQDQALKLNIDDLVSKARGQLGLIQTNELEIGGLNYEIDVQASAKENSPGEVQYYFGTIQRRAAA
ncbi:MAG: FHA domain-containing protein [Oligoflexia bacterium]|nr:FHA domain-containing protein [Oligoflexia bacterium]